MGKKDPRVDDYIARSAPFAKPILNHLRKVVHGGCPGVEETLKWGFPHFMYRGILCSMASFKAHCAFGFWKGVLLADRPGGTGTKRKAAMGQFGRITVVSDLPDKRVLLRAVKRAVALNEQGIKLPARAARKKRPVTPPDDLMAALRENRKALETYEGFSDSNRREYVEWITATRTDATRTTRLETAIAWMAGGKVRNWKYIRK